MDWKVDTIQLIVHCAPGAAANEGEAARRAAQLWRLLGDCDGPPPDICVAALRALGVLEELHPDARRARVGAAPPPLRAG